MRFWMRRRSSGSVTSAQSGSLAGALDFFVAGEADFLELCELSLDIRDDMLRNVWMGESRGVQELYNGVGDV